MSVDDRHRMNDLHRGMPTNISVNLPVSREHFIADGYAAAGHPLIADRIDDTRQQHQPSPTVSCSTGGQLSQYKSNGASGTGRRMLPNLAMLYGRAGRQYSTESQQPLRDSRDSSQGPSFPATDDTANLQTAFSAHDPSRYIFVNRNQPTDSEEEDWYDRRKRIDAEQRRLVADEGAVTTRPRRLMPDVPPLRRPVALARNQAFAMAGVPGGGGYEYDTGATYRPAPEGKSVRLPYAPSTRTVLVAVDPAEREQYQRAIAQQQAAGVYGHRFSQPLVGASARPDHLQYGLTDRLVGDALQLGRYHDPSVVEVARREMAEAYELDERQMDRAAFNLADPALLEHAGGFRPDEISDINQYSQRGLLRPVSNTTQMRITPLQPEAHPANPSEQDNDDLLLVTTL